MNAFLCVTCIILSLTPAIGKAAISAQPVPEEEKELAPYVHTGEVTFENGWGSGVLYGTDRSFITAAHVVWDDARWTWQNDLEWRGQPVRAFQVVASYQEAVSRHGVDSPPAFARDVAVGYSYEALGEPPRVWMLGDEAGDLARSSSTKMLAGFPGLPGDTHPDQLMRTGPFTAAFARNYGAYHEVSDVTLGPGGSGGGLWILKGDLWSLAGIYVARGHQLSGVALLDEPKRTLISNVLAEVDDFAPRLLNTPPSLLGFDSVLRRPLRVWFNPLAEPKARWEWRRGNDSGVVNNSFTRRTTSFAELLPIENPTFFDGAEVRLTLSNGSGVVRSEWIKLVYMQNPTPRWLQRPESLRLDVGEEGSLSAQAVGISDLSYQWEYKVPGWNDSFLPVTESAQYLSGFDSPNLLFENGAEYWDGVVFRLVVSGEGGTLTSDPLTVSYNPMPAPRIDGPPTLTLPASGPVTLKVVPESVNLSVQWEIWEPVEDGWSDLRSRTSVTQQHEELIVHNWAGINHNGFRIRAKVRIQHRHIRDGYRWEEHVTPPVTLYDDAGPVVRRSLINHREAPSDRRFEARFASATPAEVEWQWFDDDFDRWRPLPAGLNLVETEAFRSKLTLPHDLNVSRIRAILRSDGYPPEVFDEVALEPVAFQPNDDPAKSFEWEHHGTVGQYQILTDGEKVVLTARDYLLNHNSSIYTFTRDRDTWKAAPALNAPLAAESGFGGAFELYENELFVTASKTRTESGHMPGKILVYAWNASLAEWQSTQTLQIESQTQDPGVSAGRGVSRVGDYLLITLWGRHEVAVFKKSENGGWERFTTITEDHLTGWQGMEPPIFFLHQGHLVTRGSPTFVFSVRNDGTVTKVNATFPAFDPWYSHGERLWGMGERRYSGHTVQTNSWTPENGFGSTTFEEAPEYLSLDAKLHRNWLVQGNSNSWQAAPARAFYIDRDLELHGPLEWTSPVAREQTHFGAAVTATDDFLAVLSVEHTHPDNPVYDLRLDIVEIEALEARSFPKERNWLQARIAPDHPEVQLQFRSPVGAQSPQLQASSDLQSWSVLSPSSEEVLDADYDGDGKTELRRVTLPLSTTGEQRFFRLEELPAP